MKILKNNLRVRWSKKVTCTHCASKLEITRSDVKFTDTGWYLEYFTTCPVCNRRSALNYLPGKVTEAAKRVR